MKIMPILLACAAAAMLGCSPPENASAGSAGVENAAAPDTVGPTITGVPGIAWGTTAEAIVARRGEPPNRSDDAEGVKVLGYPESLAGQPVDLILFVHPRHGMFRAGYAASFQSHAECIMKLNLFDQGVSRRYPELEGVAKQIGEGEPCAALLQGTGGYLKQWTDPGNGAQVMLALQPGLPSVILTYTTPEAGLWERRKTQGQF
ncbi:MAG TPA: hypothetical protein VGB92_12820 [Longimicrobium sp.]|jgi:hypothetical protein